MPIKLTETYIDEKIDAYNTAINALIYGETVSEDPELAYKLRMKLANKLERELQDWCEKYNKEVL